MSTRGSTFWEDDDPMQWEAAAKPWCQSCCVPLHSCGCSEAERILDEAHIVRGEE
jgi:hypothetical protein